MLGQEESHGSCLILLNIRLPCSNSSVSFVARLVRLVWLLHSHLCTSSPLPCLSLSETLFCCKRAWTFQLGCHAEHLRCQCQQADCQACQGQPSHKHFYITSTLPNPFVVQQRNSPIKQRRSQMQSSMTTTLSTSSASMSYSA